MRKARLWIAVAAVTALVSNLAPAQAASAPVDRKGFYGTVGLGYGSGTSYVELSGITDNDNENGVYFFIDGGVGLNKSWRVGAQIDYLKANCSKCGGGIDATLMFYTAVATYYPSPNNFFIKLNIGYGTDEFSGGGGSGTAGGLALGLGLGYDWMPGKSPLAIVPYAAYLAQVTKSDFGGDLSGSGVSGRGAMFEIGVGIGYKH